MREQGLDLGFVALGFAPEVGGIETHLAQLARELQARGHRVHVLCIDARAERAPYVAQDELHEGVRVRRVAYRYHDHARLSDLSERRAAMDAVLAWLAEEPCDLVHVHHASGFGAALLRAIHEMGRPLLLTLHDAWLLCPRGQMLRHDGALCAKPEPAACGACLAATWPHLMPSGAGGTSEQDARAADERTQHALAMLALPQLVYAPSSSLRAAYERAGVPAGRIQVLENGVDAPALAAEVEGLRRDLDAQGPFRLGVLGTVQPSKGVLELARAALACPEPGWALEIHGALPSYHGDERYVGALRELARADARIELHGAYAHASLARILARLDAVAVPSRWEEAFGLSAREARAAGLRVLASERGGLAALAGDPGVLLLDPDDAPAWSDALARWIRERRAENGRRLVPAAGLRTVHQLALELERAYVALVREQLRLEPDLRFEAGTDRLREPARPDAKASVLARWWRRLSR